MASHQVCINLSILGSLVLCLGSFPDNASVKFSQVEGMYATSEDSRTQYGMSINESGSWHISTESSDPANSFRIGSTVGLSR